MYLQAVVIETITSAMVDQFMMMTITFLRDHFYLVSLLIMWQILFRLESPDNWDQFNRNISRLRWHCTPSRQRYHCLTWEYQT